MAEPPTAPPLPTRSLRRRLFPSTLWESRRRALRAIPTSVADDGAVLVLHTTYLAPALSWLERGGGAVVDAYDLVWRAHANDATYANPAAGGLRRAYAAMIRPREERALAQADVLVVAGADDHQTIAARLPDARWVPTPTPIEPVPAPRPGSATIRVGLIGNFAHVSTRRSLDLVLESPLARDPSVSITVVGLHSDSIAAPDRVEVLGPVARAEDFYERVDCVVAPVAGGSGIKCKLAEGVIAGRPVITTELGASGYPPELHGWLTVCEPRELDAELVRQAVEGFDPPGARAAFEQVVGAEVVADGYEAALRAVLGRG